MSKNEKKKPMTLNRETLKQIDDAALASVAGGGKSKTVSVVSKAVKDWSFKQSVKHCERVSRWVDKSASFKRPCW